MLDYTVNVYLTDVAGGYKRALIEIDRDKIALEARYA